jgi:rRNA-processing protein EBP2
MAHIKDRLIFEQRKMQSFEQRKEQTSYKKRAKQIQDERLKIKRDRKLEDMTKVEQWKKGKKDRDHNLAVRSDQDFDQYMDGSKTQRGGVKSAKRKGLDAKYGRGGKIQKNNNKDSYSDQNDGYSGRRNKTPFTGMAKGAKKNFHKDRARNGTSQRPGKARRAQQRKKQ